MGRSKAQAFVAAGTVLAVILLSASCSKPQTVFPNTIPPANKALYAVILDMAQWKNPYLTIRPEGVEMRGTAGVFAPEEIGKKLEKLPLAAWPYGRIVAVSEIGIRSRGDDRAISEVLKKALAILKDLGIEVNRVPSA